MCKVFQKSINGKLAKFSCVLLGIQQKFRNSVYNVIFYFKERKFGAKNKFDKMDGSFQNKALFQLRFSEIKHFCKVLFIPRHAANAASTAKPVTIRKILSFSSKLCLVILNLIMFIRPIILNRKNELTVNLTKKQTQV